MVPLYPPPPATKYLPFHFVVGMDTSNRIVDCGRLWMLPSTLQYSGTLPSAATTAADVILVSLSFRLAIAAQSAADAGDAPRPNEAASNATITPNDVTNLFRVVKKPEMP